MSGLKVPKNQQKMKKKEKINSFPPTDLAPMKMPLPFGSTQ
jgi:hypothetical protein